MELNKLYVEFVGPFLRELGNRIPSVGDKVNKLYREMEQKIKHGKETLEKVGEPIGAYL